MRPRRIVTRITAIAWILPVLVGSCGTDEDHGGARSHAQPSHVVAVERKSIADRYEASGTLRGQQTASLTSKVSGYVEALRVDSGDRVSASQVLAVLDVPELEARVHAAESGLEEAEQAVVEAEAALGAANAQAEVAIATFQRFRELQEKRAVTRQEFDEVEARHEAALAERERATAGLARARSARSRAEAEVRAVRALFDYSRVRAPFDGRVLERQIDLGNLATPGTPLFILEKDGPLRAEVSVEESMAGRIKTGDRADVYVAQRREPLDGTVTKVVPRVDVRSRAFRVEVELPAGSQADLVPGGFVRVALTVGETERLLVPRSAIVTRGQLSMVYVVEEDTPPRLRLVTLGRERGDDVEVLSGLSAGERIASEPSQIDDPGEGARESS